MYRPVQYGFLSQIRNMFPGKEKWTRKELHNFSISIGFSGIPSWILNDRSRRSSRGIYGIPEVHLSDQEFKSLKVVGDGRGRPRKHLSSSSLVSSP
jgi:hypothetical protein